MWVGECRAEWSRDSPPPPPSLSIPALFAPPIVRQSPAFYAVIGCYCSWSGWSCPATGLRFIHLVSRPAFLSREQPIGAQGAGLCEKSGGERNWGLCVRGCHLTRLDNVTMAVNKNLFDMASDGLIRRWVRADGDVSMRFMNRTWTWCFFCRRIKVAWLFVR